MNRKRIPALLACLLALLLLAGTASAALTPVQVIETVASELDRQVAGRQQALRNDPARLSAIINQVFLPHFDVDYAAILVLGRHAREATPAQRQQFAQLFYKSVVDRYADGLLNYRKGAVKVLPFRGELNAKRTIVRSTVTTDDGKTIAVDYAFRQGSDGEWRVYDVIIEGISYISNYRNQVDEEIRAIGIDGLIQRLQRQGAQALQPVQGK